MKSLKHNDGANEMQAQSIRFKYTNNVEEVRRLDLDGDDVLVIRGEPEGGSYEWVLIKGGEVAKHSDDGYGWVLAALRDGLAFYTGGE
jgi:hypothetical protein